MEESSKKCSFKKNHEKILNSALVYEILKNILNMCVYSCIRIKLLCKYELRNKEL